MERTRIAIYDTTLRDGAQQEGISLSVADKLRIVKALDKIGIAYVEGGWPGMGPKDSEFFTKAGELIKTIIEWTLKSLMTFVIGINVIRSLINPIVDSMKVGTMWKVMQSIPGIGNTLNSVSSVVFASGTLIKNGIGISAMIAILVICFIPVVKTSVIAISYKGVSAILEPVSDKRIVNSINTIHISFCLMLKTLLYATVFFILTIAIICASTNLNVG